MASSASPMSSVIRPSSWPVVTFGPPSGERRRSNITPRSVSSDTFERTGRCKREKLCDHRALRLLDLGPVARVVWQRHVGDGAYQAAPAAQRLRWAIRRQDNSQLHAADGGVVGAASIDRWMATPASSPATLNDRQVSATSRRFERAAAARAQGRSPAACLAMQADVIAEEDRADRIGTRRRGAGCAGRDEVMVIDGVRSTRRSAKRDARLDRRRLAGVHASLGLSGSRSKRACRAGVASRRPASHKATAPRALSWD